MKWEDVQLVKDIDGTEYLEYSERQTKTKIGGDPRNIRAVKPKASSNANTSPEKNPVFVYKFYSEKRPSSMKDSDVSFYLDINHINSPTTSAKLWFK